MKPNRNRRKFYRVATDMLGGDQQWIDFLVGINAQARLVYTTANPLRVSRGSCRRC